MFAKIVLISYQGFLAFLADLWEILTQRLEQYLTIRTISSKDSFLREQYSLRLSLIYHKRCIILLDYGSHSLHPSC